MCPSLEEKSKLNVDDAVRWNNLKIPSNREIMQFSQHIWLLRSRIITNSLSYFRDCTFNHSSQRN